MVTTIASRHQTQYETTLLKVYAVVTTRATAPILCSLDNSLKTTKYKHQPNLARKLAQYSGTWH